MFSDESYEKGRMRGFSVIAAAILALCAVFGAVITWESSDAAIYGSESDPLTSLDMGANEAMGNTYYVSVGSNVTISADGNWVTLGVTSGYGLSESGASFTGTITKTGTIAVEFWIPDGEEYNQATIIAVDAPGKISIYSVGGTEATVGYRYTYSVQTTPSDAEISISGVDWLSVSGHTISGTPTSAGSYTLEITAFMDGYASATEEVVIVVSEAPVTEGAPTITDFSYSVSTGNAYRITFSVTAVDASSISIDYGDGTSGTGSSSTHTYGRSGSYTVRATATNAAGSATEVLNILIADSVPGTSVQYNHAYTFTLGIDTDGVTPSVTGCPFLSVTAGSNYVTVLGTPSSTSYVGQTYSITLAVGSYVLTWDLTVTEGSTVPTAGFTYEVDGLKVTVTSTASNEDTTFYQWTENGSFVQSNTGTTSYTYTEPGTYKITQRVTATIDGQTITDEFSSTVVVTGNEPVPEPEEDPILTMVGIALAVVGVIALIAAAFIGRYDLALVSGIVVVVEALIWWML